MGEDDSGGVIETGSDGPRAGFPSDHPPTKLESEVTLDKNPSFIDHLFPEKETRCAVNTLFLCK